MKTTTHNRKRTIWIATVSVELLLLVMSSATVFGQWTNGTDISNTNTGKVGVGTSSPGAKLDVLSSGTARVLLGDGCLDSGSFGGIGLGITSFSGCTNYAMIGDGTNTYFNAPSGYLAFRVGNADKMVITSSGNVGIGAAGPSSKLQVQGDNSLTSGTYVNTLINGTQTAADSGAYIGFDVNPSYSNSGTLNLMYGSTSYPFNTGTGTINAMYGQSVEPLNLSSGNVGAMIGVVNGPGNYGSGSIGSLYGDYVYLINLGTGTVTNAYGMFIDNPLKGTSATISNNYGIFIANQTAATNNYSIYSAGGTNYFGGNMGIGTATPGYKLDVAGTVRSSTGGFMFPNGTVQTTAATMTGLTAGAGLTGGGTSGSATIDVGQGTGVTVSADSISVNYGSTAGTAVQGNTSITVSAGDGMSGGGPLTLGSGGTLTLNNVDKGSAQNIFKNVANASGTTQFSAGSNSDGIRFAGTGGASVTFDASTKKVTVDASSITSSQWTGSGDISYSGGNVGIGRTPGTGNKLDVNGNTNFTGDITLSGHINARYQDLAEWVPSSEQLPTGTVVVLDSTKSNQVIASSVSYDTRVAGVISEQPGIALGERGANKVLVATTGRVRVKVDATRAPIQVGDLLVASDIPGMAMKSEPVNIGGVQLHRPGTLIGKALEPLAKGKGTILVLLSLQ